MSRWIPVVGAIVVLGSMVLAEHEAPRTFGWHGNWTGLHPSAQGATILARRFAATLEM